MKNLFITPKTKLTNDWLIVGAHRSIISYENDYRKFEWLRYGLFIVALIDMVVAEAYTLIQAARNDSEIKRLETII